MTPIRRVLIANRGEIAARIVRACRAMRIESVLAVSEADRDSLPARMADRAVCIGPAAPGESYLRVETLIAACIGTGADALHPGYGFLSERAELAEACERGGIAFVGPSADSIRRMGDKLAARRIAAACGVATLPGSQPVRSGGEAIGVAGRIGYPVLLKASAGGGGRGMRVARAAEDLARNFDTVSAEAHAAFGDGTIYVERYIANARHVEVQVLGDVAGNVIHLGERDCSVQRRFQKVIEEAPSPVVPERLRAALCDAAVMLARHIGYWSAGTVEFLLEQDSERFYFLEMNTRIQVEHPVTEEISGIDLVQEQLRVAGGAPLRLTQDAVRLSGHAIECRINAESPERGFAPSPGRIGDWQVPREDGVRVDTHCYAGYFVAPYYDSLLAKVVARGADRAQAIARMRNALETFAVTGLETNLAFHRRVLDHADFRNASINTRWLEEVVLAGAGRAA
ncbi:MAG: acetyl-CoA carboxylase biotin carboxylase subunit [Burkholderiales bacterium]|nr:acetyl-CoA carboxylase biotin carboxylase subunit [Burkholderiales bacterium]